MLKRVTKATSLLVVAASIVSIVPAVAADYQKVDAQEGYINAASAEGNGIFVIDGEVNGSDDDEIYYLAGGKYTALDYVESGDTIDDTYSSKYKRIIGNKGDNIIDLTDGKESDDFNFDVYKDDIARNLKKKIKKDNDGRFDSADYDNTTVAADTTFRFDGKQFMYGAFGNWSQFDYNLKTPNINGTTTSTIYTDPDGNYVDADYNLGRIQVFTTTSESAYVENTKDTYDITENGKKYELKAQIENVKAYTEGYDALYRTAKLTIWKKEKDASDDEYENITDSVKFGSTSDQREVPTNEDGSITVLQKISKAQSSDTVDGIKYAKDVATYFITDKDGKTESVLGIDHPYNPSGISTNVDGIVSYYYDSDNKELNAEAINLKSYKDYNYVDLSDSDEVDVDAWANGGGQIYGVGDGYVYKWDGKDKFEKIYKVDSSMSNISVSDENNIIVWNKDKDIYSAISNKASTSTGNDTATTAGVTTTTGAAVTTTTVRTGWVKGDDGNWSYNDTDGSKKKGWLMDSGSWYYLKANGTMATGWINDGDYWYYLKANGAMSTGWINDNGSWYYCSESGEMLADTTVDGYVLGSSGAWIN